MGEHRKSWNLFSLVDTSGRACYLMPMHSEKLDAPSPAPPLVTVEGVLAWPLPVAVERTGLDRRTILKHCRTWRLCERMTMVATEDVWATWVKVTGGKIALGI